MRTLFAVLVLGVVLSCTSVFAQFGPNPNFKNKDLYIGPRIGLGYVAGAAFGVGANVEYAVAPQIGVTGLAGWSSWGSSYWTYTNIIIGVGGNFHFDLLKVNKLDTYAGLGLGWNIGSVTTNDALYPYSGTYGGFFWDLRIGGRYFISDKMAVTGELGYGFGYLRLGLDFKL